MKSGSGRWPRGRGRRRRHRRGHRNVAGAAGTQAAHKKATGPWTIGLSNGYYGNGARVQLEAEVKAYAALPSVKGKVKKLIINNAGTSVAAQIAAVDR